MTEVVQELIRHAFVDLHIETIWCGYFDGNDKSRRVQEKCGFVYHHTNKDIYRKLMDDIRTEHITRLTKEEWKAGISEKRIVKLCERYGWEYLCLVQGDGDEKLSKMYSRRLYDRKGI